MTETIYSKVSGSRDSTLDIYYGFKKYVADAVVHQTNFSGLGAGPSCAGAVETVIWRVGGTVKEKARERVREW